MIIYKITNKVNGKIYIGQTIRPLLVRWKHHCNPANKNCVAMHRAIQKYGKENFTVEQIDVACDRDELDKKEIYWIEFYDSMNPDKGYNLIKGGEHREISEETKRRLSSVAKGRKMSSTTKLKMSTAHKGQKLSEESIAKCVATKRANGTYEKIAKIAPINAMKCAKKVKCIETNEVFESITEAAKAKGVFRQNLSACLRGVRMTAGNLHWGYVK